MYLSEHPEMILEDYGINFFFFQVFTLVYDCVLLALVATCHLLL